MPEIAEVARVVHHLKKHLVGKTLQHVKAQDDANVFGKAGTTAAEFENALTGKKVVDAGQQGKYFWLILSSPPHPVFHFGMTGWFYIRGEPSVHYRPKDTQESEVWPPKFTKFQLSTAGNSPAEAAFADARRFARVRLVDCKGEDIRKSTPLKENGPDPVIDSDVLTEEWLASKMRSKRVPVKALLLDQANISGIGNWVGDEILYHARLHPEQYSDTFSSAQLKQLHTSMMYICRTAVDLLADSDKFPNDWLFKHRWGKGKKGSPMTLPSGEKITFLTVGGRTSCVVPSRQKKTGAVAGDLGRNEKDGEIDEASDIEPDVKSTTKEPTNGASKSSKKAKKESATTTAVKSEHEDISPPKAKSRKRKSPPTEPIMQKGEKEHGQAANTSKKVKAKQTPANSKTSKKVPATKEPAEQTTGRRRSGRLAT